MNNMSCCENLRKASYEGHLSCLKYLSESGQQLTDQEIHWVAVRGHLDCLEYIHERGVQLEDGIVYWASKKGHLPCLKYAHENGCPFHKKTTYITALNGCLDCLRYIFEVIGCEVAPWDERLDKHMDSFSNEVKEYLKEVRDDWVNKRNRLGINVKG